MKQWSSPLPITWGGSWPSVAICIFYILYIPVTQLANPSPSMSTSNTPHENSVSLLKKSGHVCLRPIFSSKAEQNKRSKHDVIARAWFSRYKTKYESQSPRIKISLQSIWSLTPFLGLASAWSQQPFRGFRLVKRRRALKAALGFLIAQVTAQVLAHRNQNRLMRRMLGLDEITYLSLE